MPKTMYRLVKGIKVSQVNPPDLVPMCKKYP